jgi:peptidyl-prolyl cis-trans isomerase C
MTRVSKESVNMVTVRLTTLLAVSIVGTVLLFTSCAPPPEEGVVAVVHGRQITQADFDTRWGELAEATKVRYQKEGG